MDDDKILNDTKTENDTTPNDVTTEDDTPKKRKYNFFIEWILPIIVAIVLAILVKNYVIFKVYIPSSSMKPTINEENQLLVTHVYNYDNLKRGDIVVFYSNELQETLIKRLIGLPNDHIEIKDGKVIINGETLSEDYINTDENDNLTHYENYTGTFDVPDNCYFFLGDNRGNSKDSRYWNNPYIDEDCIEGKALIRVYPFSEFGSLD